MDIVFIALLSFLTSFITILPILHAGTQSVFYSFEPDIVYVSNAINYIYTGKVNYIDHPGTVAIQLISFALQPLRLFSKFIAKQDFISWTINYQQFTYLYIRVFYSLLLFIALFIFLNAVYKHSRSLLMVIFSFLALHAFRDLPTFLGAYIASETPSFLILSIWFYLFVLYLKKPVRLLGLGLSFLAGLAIASKFTSIFFAPMTLLLLILGRPKISANSIKTLLLGSFVILFGFIVGTWPTHHLYPLMLNWVYVLFTTPNLHGGGQTTLLDPKIYSTSAMSLFNLETSAAVLAVFFIRYLTETNLAQSIVFLTSIIGVLVFAKYPLPHYQLPNYFGIVFISSLIFNKFKAIAKIAVITVLMYILSANITSYYKDIAIELNRGLAIEKYLKQNPAQKGSLWEFGRSSDYTLLHSRDWLGHIYAQPLRSVRPNLYNFTGDFSKVITPIGDKVDIDQICFDKLYVQTVSLPSLLTKHPFLTYLPRHLILGSSGDVIEINNPNCPVKK